MDDANVPSLLSLPYLDPQSEVFDRQIYKSTRKFVLSRQNPWYFEGSAGKGIGSPHTGWGRIWPMSIIMVAHTAETTTERDEAIASLMSLQVSGKGLTESFDKDDASSITRPWFAWPNALFGNLMIELGQCRPKTEHAKFPQVHEAPREGPLANLPKNIGFYQADPTLLMREDVVLPSGFVGPSARPFLLV